MAETWNDVPDSGGYQASTRGRIRSTKYGEPCIITPKNGRVVIYKTSTERVCVTVARLVCLAFHGPNPPKMLALRFKGDDDRPENVRWASRSEIYEAKIRCLARPTLPRQGPPSKRLKRK